MSTAKGWRLSGYALLLAAAVFLTWSLWTLFQSGRAEGHELADDRDRVTRIATEQLTVLNSMEAKRADIDLAHWLEVSTGPLHDELKRDQAAARAKFVKAGTTAKGEITGLAVTALDAKAGSATVIASVRVHLSGGVAGQASEQRKRYEAGMERNASGTWKVKSLSAIPAGGAAAPKVERTKP